MKLKILFFLTFSLGIFAACTKKEQPEQSKTITLTEDIVISKPIILFSGMRFDGAGHSITLSSGANCPVLIIGSPIDDPTPSKDISVTNVVINGNAENQPDEIWGGRDRGVRNNGISIRNSSNVIVDNVHVSNCRSGGIVLERGCRGVIVTNSSSRFNEFDGLAGYETEDSIFFNLDLTDNKAAGISFDLNLNKNYVVRNRIENNKEIGIFIRNANENTFEDLAVSNSVYGVFMAESELPNSAATNNVFKKVAFAKNQFAFRVNNISCVGNVLDTPVFVDNQVNISEIQERLLSIKKIFSLQ